MGLSGPFIFKTPRDRLFVCIAHYALKLLNLVSGQQFLWMCKTCGKINESDKWQWLPSSKIIAMENALFIENIPTGIKTEIFSGYVSLPAAWEFFFVSWTKPLVFD